MAWFKIDDCFPDHPKLEGLEADPVEHAVAVAAWTLMGADCARRRTDGVFSLHRLRKVLPWPEDMIERASAALVRVGLWIERGDGRRAFHDWEDYQPTKAELEAERRAATERQRRWRTRRRAERLAKDAVDASTDAVTDVATNAVSHAERNDERRRSTGAPTSHVPVDGAPSRPDPTRSSSLRSEGDRDPDLTTEGMIRVGFARFYAEAKATLWPPSQATAEELHAIAAWVEGTADREKLTAGEVVQRLIANFAADDYARSTRMPWAHFRKSYADYWRKPKPAESTEFEVQTW